MSAFAGIMVLVTIPYSSKLARCSRIAAIAIFAPGSSVRPTTSAIVVIGQAPLVPAPTASLACALRCFMCVWEILVASIPYEAWGHAPVLYRAVALLLVLARLVILWTLFFGCFDHFTEDCDHSAASCCGQHSQVLACLCSLGIDALSEHYSVYLMPDTLVST